MQLRNQLIGAVALAAVTYFGVLRIAEAKCDEAVGSVGVLLNEDHAEEFAAFKRLQDQLVIMGQAGLAERLEGLRLRRELWVANEIGPDRWAAYVESLGLVRRVYIRRLALLNPRGHLYPKGADAVPEGHQAAFAWLSLGGAMRHEIAHRDGAREETQAYSEEIAWYEDIHRSAFLTRLEGDERAAWDWAIQAAFMSARKAAQRAAQAPG